MEGKNHFVIAVADIETNQNNLIFGENMGALIDNTKALMVSRLGVNQFPAVTQSLSELKEQFQDRFILSAYQYIE
jgi:hypothetical protein